MSKRPIAHLPVDERNRRREYARRLFTENPHLQILDAVTICREAGQELGRSELSAIRSIVRLRLDQRRRYRAPRRL